MTTSPLKHFGTNLFAYCCNEPVNNVDPEGTKYLPSKAQAYALKWWCYHNTSRYKTNRSDCANFVSQCLYAGGLSKMTGIIGSSSGWHHYKVANNFQISDAWGIANKLYSWLKNKHASFIKTFTNKKKLNEYIKSIYSNYEYCTYAIFLIGQTMVQLIMLH